ncbi:hypothetical protein GCM10010260_72890 [Streptomyces filipinensis]|uniref:Peptidase M48 domain-containing protein n=1 Tax=Streptomyces filipinensis TaxID=66887 RepID=A0A918IKW9_9ACTN|nr:hypothetical protein [Streptomyces filipinensis]GGV22096.1 hypothetical protein GCM10010260_72890 [Streptomyces filipinensis]
MTTKTEKARAYLWELQAQLAGATGMREAVWGTGEVAGIVEVARRMPGVSEEQLEHLVRSAMTPPEHWPPRGPYEPLWGHRLVHFLADRLELAFEGPFTRPVLGMLATGEINAVTLLAPDSQTHIVVFEDELFNFANLFGKAVALAMPYEVRGDGWIAFSPGIDDVRRHVRESTDAIHRFRDVVLAYVLTGRPSAASPYQTEPVVRAMSSILLDGMELFVLGHEYGHAMAGHVADRTSRRMLGVGDVDVTEVTWKWEQEALADIIGWKLCVGAMGKKFGLELAHAGVELFFSACEVLDQAVSLLTTGERAPHAGSSSHPPIGIRREVVREEARDELGERAAPILDMGTTIHEVVEVLWAQTAPVLLDLHRQGVAPDARWTANL